MINLKNLKSLFIVEDEINKANQQTNNNNKQTTAPQKTSKSKSKSKTVTANNNTHKTKTTITSTPKNKKVSTSKQPQKTNQTGKVDKKKLELLLKAIEANNLQGFDYLEFQNSLQALQNLPMDEATRYRSAFATASTLGLTLDKLVETANYYKQTLDKEKDKFRTALQEQVQQHVVSRDREKVAIEKSILKRKEQIKALEEQIKVDEQRLNNIAGELSKVQAKIEATKNNFITTFNHLYNRIESDISNIKKYLGNQ